MARGRVGDTKEAVLDATEYLFALAEAISIVASVARHYPLDLVPGGDVKPLPRGTSKPNSQVRMVPRAVGDEALAR